MDRLLPAHDLSTVNKQFTTHDDGSFDRTEYLDSPMQSPGCMEPSTSRLFNGKVGDLTVSKRRKSAALCTIFARLRTIGWDPAAIMIPKGSDCNKAFPDRAGSSLRLHADPGRPACNLRPIHMNPSFGAHMDLGSTVTYPLPFIMGGNQSQYTTMISKKKFFQHMHSSQNGKDSSSSDFIECRFNNQLQCK